ncbi:MAG: methyltransferase domain-containing protein [Planctomycetes bacterium]|nr:methyltransferase domain-containing protein [Planctomycetota bacterium]
MSRQAKRTLLQRLRKNLKHVIPPMLRTKKAREFAPEELQELCEFTGLEPEAVKEYLSRKKGRRISNEFDWLNPKNAPEYLWFYRGSRTYLFAADEAWDRAVELTEPGMKCLDFGGGGGRNALAMAAKGAKVYYVDIGLINSAFTKFRARRQNLELQVLDPLVQIDGRWVLDTAEAAKLEGGFDLIVCDNVLEHVHDYHLVLAKLAAALAPQGRILECTPFKREKAYLFKKKEQAWDIHLPPKVPMLEAMQACGMRRGEGEGLWERSA